MKYVLVPADRAENCIVVVRHLYYVDTLKRELIGTNISTNVYKRLLSMGMVVIQP